MAGRAKVKRTLSPFNHHQNLASFGGTDIGVSKVVLNQNFTHLLGNVVHLSAIAAPQGDAIFGVKSDFNVSAVSMTDVDSHNRYPLSFFYNYYTPNFDKSQVKFWLTCDPARVSVD